MKKIALRIGNFDPIHYGHLFRTAAVLRSKLIDEIWFIPRGGENNKRPAMATPEQRFFMCRLAVDYFFSKEAPIKIKDPNIYGNFTCATEIFDMLSREFPGIEFYSIIGSDYYPDFLSWGPK